MTAFSASDAALEGFRITRERPRALMAWTGFSVAAGLAGALITLAMPKEARDALASLANEQRPDPEAFLQSLIAVSPVLVVGLIVQRMMDAAVYRLMLRPQDNRFGFLRLGPDELRLAALRLIYLVLAVVLVAAAQVAVALLAFAFSFFGQPVMFFVASVAELFSWGLIVVLAVRLSLASVITFDRRRLAILDSWEITRGRFWQLLGIYLLAVSCAAVLGILLFMVFVSLSGVALIVSGGSLTDLRAIIQPEDVRLTTYLNPFVIAYILVGSLFTAIYTAVIAAPGAFIYKILGRGEPAGPAASPAV